MESVLEGWRRGARGPLPQITPLQLLSALILIDREGPMGRRSLARTLQINDGVARGLLERLADNDLVSVAETGVELSKPGKQSLQTLLRKLSVRRILQLPDSDIISEHATIGIHLKGAYRRDMTGIAQRDEAIKAGAEGAITVAVVKGKMVIPPDNKGLAKLSPKENARLRTELKPSNNDLVIIGFGKDEARALEGALAAVFSLNQP